MLNIAGGGHERYCAAKNRSSYGECRSKQVSEKEEMMLRFFRLLVSVTLCTGISVPMLSDVWAGETMDRISAKGIVVIASDPAWPPYSWRDTNGNWFGYDVEVAIEIARRLGAKPEFVGPPWDEQTAGHWNGKWDVSVGSMTPTVHRAKNLDFPAVYNYGMASLAVQKDNTTIKTPSDASGKRIGILGGTTYEMYLRRQPMDVLDMPPYVYKIDNPIIVTFETEPEAFDALAAGKVDAIINYLPTLLFEIKNGRPFKVVGQPLFLPPSAIAIDRGDPELHNRLREIVTQMNEDGTLTTLSVKWFDFDFTKF